MDAKRFFETALPQMLVKHLDTFLLTQGSISFSIRDAGSWTLRWGDIEAPISAVFSGDADLKLWLSAEAWQAWMEGTLDPFDAIASGEIVMEGKEDLLETFGYFLRPSTTLFDVYLQS
jgi:hypothetical protein